MYEFIRSIQASSVDRSSYKMELTHKVFEISDILFIEVLFLKCNPFVKVLKGKMLFKNHLLSVVKYFFNLFEIKYILVLFMETFGQEIKRSAIHVFLQILIK